MPSLLVGALSSQPKTLGDILYAETERLSRVAAVLLAGSIYTVGLVLGRATLGAVSAAAKSGGNTGNGTFTLDATTPKLANAQVGVYTATCITAAANSGTFQVTDPSGRVLGNVVVGATFANHIKFVIADGAADFVVGDAFAITIAEGSGKYAPLDPTALDGRQSAAGVCGTNVDATSADAKGVVVARLAGVIAEDLTWPGGITAAQKATALAELERRNILVTSGI